MASAAVVIVGGGVVGTSIAYHLAKRGAGRDVVLLEKNTIGSGSTAAAGGAIRGQFSTEINIRFSIESLRFWRRFEEEMGATADFREEGLMFLGRTAEQAEQFRSNVALQNHMGVPSRIIGDAEAERLVPGMRTDDLTAITYCAEDGRAGPNEATRAFAERARDGGVTIRTGVEVTGVDISGGRVRAVETSDGRIDTESVVDAAGPWAAEVGRLAGVKVPVRPYRRTIFISEPFDGLPRSFPCIVDIHVGWALLREAGALYMTGGVDVASSFTTEVDRDSLARSAEIALNRIPLLEHARFGKRVFAGLYDASPDQHAILGAVPEVGGFYLACGFSGHGFQHSPATGRVMAELLLTGTTTGIDIRPLSVTRFATGALVREPLTSYAGVIEG
jgi:glycine/D-amino acid oxidase-like deaminating enzyme